MKSTESKKSEEAWVDLNRKAQRLLKESRLDCKNSNEFKKRVKICKRKYRGFWYFRGKSILSEIILQRSKIKPRQLGILYTTM